ncbi:hypothetical protein AJ87_48475 [Rhizobium yanglingense]|nr:hypothetical protein AJ87_48475 [Rhizobium yanglingense]
MLPQSIVGRPTIRMMESREVVPFDVADQIAFAGKLTSGALVASHLRGGLSRATNFHMEIIRERDERPTFPFVIEAAR